MTSTHAPDLHSHHMPVPRGPLLAAVQPPTPLVFDATRPQNDLQGSLLAGIQLLGMGVIAEAMKPRIGEKSRAIPTFFTSFFAGGIFPASRSADSHSEPAAFCSASSHSTNYTRNGQK